MGVLWVALWGACQHVNLEDRHTLARLARTPSHHPLDREPPVPRLVHVHQSTSPPCYTTHHLR